MCFSCSILCENCRPKWLACKNCGSRNLMQARRCVVCDEPIGDDARENAYAAWAKAKAERDRQEGTPAAHHEENLGKR